MPLQRPSFPPVIGESVGDRICRVVLHYVGCSLSNRRDELAALVGENAVAWETNCETTAIGILRALGLDLPDVQGPLKNGLEGSVIEHVAAKAGGWCVPDPRCTQVKASSLRRNLVRPQVEPCRIQTGNSPRSCPPPGALMHYRSVPYRVNAEGATIYDDHVEWMLDGPDHHAGGGRENNAITDQHSDIHWSAGRPLVGWLDPDTLGLPDATAPETT